jgi:hypothetical protein
VSVFPRRLLIATGEAAADLGELPFGTRSLIDAASEVLVVVPALPTRIAWLASDTDKTREVADRRLQAVLGQLGEAEVSAEGVVGADDPLLAFEDAIRDFRPDHILIALRGPLAPAGRSRAWSRRSLTVSGCR